MKILMGYDGSEESKKALDIIKRCAKILSVEAYVLTDKKPRLPPENMPLNPAAGPEPSRRLLRRGRW